MYSKGRRLWSGKLVAFNPTRNCRIEKMVRHALISTFTLYEYEIIEGNVLLHAIMPGFDRLRLPGWIVYIALCRGGHRRGIEAPWTDQVHWTYITSLLISQTRLKCYICALLICPRAALIFFLFTNVSNPGAILTMHHNYRRPLTGSEPKPSPNQTPSP